MGSAVGLPAGCSFSSGHDYAATVTWLINGVPPDSKVCARYGIDRIRFHVKSTTRDRILEAPCNRSVRLSDDFDYGGFRTTNAFDYGTTYTYEVTMLDKNGKVALLDDQPLSYQDTFEASATDGRDYELPPLELFSPLGDTADVDASFTIKGQIPTTENCAAAGIDAVYIDVASATDPDFQQTVSLGRVPCADGVFISNGPVLTTGEFYIKYAAVDKDDYIVSEKTPTSKGSQDYEIYAVDRSGTLTVSEVDLP